MFRELFSFQKSDWQFIVALLCLAPLLSIHVNTVSGETASASQDIPLIKIDAERLPDLNIPRNAHAAFCANGEVTVVGGHTKSFVPTATAEYFKNGEWHLINTEYPHDNGLCVVLRSGKVILAGGHSESMGIGQSYPVEEYDPTTHSFRGFSCLNRKRTLAAGTELDSGKILVTGNWYAEDGIEMFDGDRDFSFVKNVSVGRASPYILRSSDEDVLILGNGGLHGEALCSDVVDRLKGEPLHVPLLRQWKPLFYEAPFCSDTGFIGNEDADDYSWLLPVEDFTVGDSTDWHCFRPKAFLLLRDSVFSLLPTTCPFPVNGLYGPILYYSPVIADRQAHRGYVHGIDKDNRHYVLCVEYDKTPAPLTLYYTDPLPEAGFPEIVLTDDGNMMIVGGITYNKDIGGSLQNDNFSPLATVFLLHVSNNEIAKTPNNASGIGLWITLILAVLVTVAAMFVIFRRRYHQNSEESLDDSCKKSHTTRPDSAVEISTSNPSEALMLHICELMEKEQLYLNSELRLTDMAAMLNTNRNVISNCINSQHGCSFSQFVNEYRVNHAQKLMRQHPDMKASEVWISSGFSTESSFFRSFKAVTGMTPSEWKNTRSDRT